MIHGGWDVQPESPDELLRRERSLDSGGNLGLDIGHPGLEVDVLGSRRAGYRRLLFANSVRFPLRSTSKLEKHRPAQQIEREHMIYLRVDACRLL